MATIAQKRASWIKLLLLTGGLILLACLLGIGGIMVYGFLSLPAGGSSSGVISSTYAIEYYVKTDMQTADITYSNSTGDTEQKEVASPWSYKFTATKGVQTFLYISAQRNGDGDVTCEIRVDGVTVKRAASHGEYVIATCSGSIQ